MKKATVFLATAAALGVAMFPTQINQAARGLRNNNPLNIKEGPDGGAEWEGEHELDLDPTFEEFITPVHGIRAGARILRTYAVKYGLDTIAGIIARWAPTSENDTQNYINFVAKKAGISANEKLNDDTYPAVISAMIDMENGSNPYTYDEIKQGFEWGFYG